MGLRALHRLPMDVHRVRAGCAAGVPHHPGYILVVPTLQLIVGDHVAEVHLVLQSGLREPRRVVAASDADQGPVLGMRLDLLYDAGEDLRRPPIAPMGRVAADLDEERWPLCIRAVMRGLVAHLHAGIRAVPAYPPQRVGHGSRIGRDQGLGPSAEVRLMVVPDRMHGERGLSALRRVLGHHHDGIDPHTEILGLPVEGLPADMDPRDAHQDVVPALPVDSVVRVAHIAPPA